MDTDVVVLQGFGDVLGVVRYFFTDRADFDLHRREPQRKSSRVVFDKNAEEAFDGAEQRAMHHEGLVAGAIFADVFETEAGGEIEIELDGGELPGSADGVD